MKREEEFYNELAARIHEWNKKWWCDLEGNPIDRNPYEAFTLMVSELSEAMEGARKNLMDDHLPHRKMEEVEIADFIIRLLDYSSAVTFILEKPSDALIHSLYVPDNVGEALFGLIASVVELGMFTHKGQNNKARSEISIMISAAELYCEKRGLDLWPTVYEKCAYNRTRADHSIEERKKEHGKKW